MSRVDELRAKYWKMRTQLEHNTTLDRQIQLNQFEMQVEIAAQLIEMNDFLKRVGVLNFEEIALRLGELLEKGKVLTTDGNRNSNPKI